MNNAAMFFQPCGGMKLCPGKDCRRWEEIARFLPRSLPAFLVVRCQGLYSLLTGDDAGCLFRDRKARFLADAARFPRRPVECIHPESRHR